MDARRKLESLFPSIQEVPPEADFATLPATTAPGSGPDRGLYYLVDGEVRRWAGERREVLSSVCIAGDGRLRQRAMGPEAVLTREESLAALEAAVRAWDRGRGSWPTMRVGERAERLQAFVQGMREVREETVRLLTWEIGKTRSDSEREFDRTVQYIVDTIEALKETDRAGSRFSSNAGILAQIRRAPLGVVLCMGPFNYPLNETFTTLIPALAMGNTVVCKLPRFGGLCQAGLLRLFAECFPAGVVNIANGDGRVVCGPIMETGEIAALAFIGSARAANVLKKQHPLPNRLRCVLGLDAKNPAVVMADADLDLAVAECVTGALSFNGQRCTAIKIIFAHRSISDAFVARLASAVDALPFGMPWQTGVKLTPMPEADKPARMQELVDDAVAGGARIANSLGGLSRGTFFFPAVVYPVGPAASLWSVEQFGPVVPVAAYDDIREVFDYVVSSSYGQQASIFGRDATEVGALVDALANQVCRVNLNAQCQRGPDVYPFTGRKDSAESTLSVSDALRCFSIRSMVAAPDTVGNKELLRRVLDGRLSSFISTDYLF